MLTEDSNKNLSAKKLKNVEETIPEMHFKRQFSQKE